MLLLAKPWDSDSQEYDLTIESIVASKLPLTRIAYGTQLSQNLKRIYTAYGLISVEQVARDVQSIIAHALANMSFSEQNKIDIIKYAIQSIYQFGDYYFNITSPKGFSPNDCVFISTDIGV